MGAEQRLRRALVDWMVNHRPGDHVDVPVPMVMSRHRALGSGGESVQRWPVDEVLQALRNDSTPAPVSATVLLGLPSGASFGRIAQVLQRAKADDPACTWSVLVLGLACRPLRNVVDHGTRTSHRVPMGHHSRAAVVADRP